MSSTPATILTRRSSYASVLLLELKAQNDPSLKSKVKVTNNKCDCVSVSLLPPANVTDSDYHEHNV